MENSLSKFYGIHNNGSVISKIEEVNNKMFIVIEIFKDSEQRNPSFKFYSDVKDDSKLIYEQKEVMNKAINFFLALTEHKEKYLENNSEDKVISEKTTQVVNKDVNTNKISNKSVADLTKLNNALKLIVNYRNYKNVTMEDLFRSEDASNKKLLEWFASSKFAQERYPNEHLAAKTILESTKN